MTGPSDERTLLTEVTGRLTAGYPDVPLAMIGEVVHDLHMRFGAAPIRDFIPLLVERMARTALDELSISYA